MQKVGILNSSIAKVLADLGHTDKICVGDCGLPVPAGVPKIDLALRLGEPPFIEVIKEMAKYIWHRKRKSRIPPSGKHCRKYFRKAKWNG